MGQADLKMEDMFISLRRTVDLAPRSTTSALAAEIHTHTHSIYGPHAAVWIIS